MLASIYAAETEAISSLFLTTSAKRWGISTVLPVCTRILSPLTAINLSVSFLDCLGINTLTSFSFLLFSVFLSDIIFSFHITSCMLQVASGKWQVASCKFRGANAGCKNAGCNLPQRKL
ncbi:MAG: hypothetical protein E7533_04665 [Ruminococcaceae bacterium]|nr:hypothetical protein [Oscillospiraceae bacterium]